MSIDKMKISSRQVKEGLFEVNGIMFYAKSMLEAIQKYLGSKEEES